MELPSGRACARHATAMLITELTRQWDVVLLRVASVSERAPEAFRAEEESPAGVRGGGAGLRGCGGLWEARGPPLARGGRVALRAARVAVARAHRARLVAEHAGVAALVPARVDQLPLLALVEWHVAAGAARAARLALQQLSDRRQV